MADRITITHLRSLAKAINVATGMPQDYYNASGKLAVGHYFVETGAGGYRLVQVRENGAERAPAARTCHTARITYLIMEAYISGYNDAKIDKAER